MQNILLLLQRFTMECKFFIYIYIYIYSFTIFAQYFKWCNSLKGHCNTYFWIFLSQWAQTLACVHVRFPAPCEPAAPTAPARPWSACGAAAPSAVWIPMRTSSPSPTASAWSGKLETVAVSAGSYHQEHLHIKIHGRLEAGVMSTHYCGEHSF